MCNSKTNQLTCQKIFLLKEPVRRAVYHASRVHVPNRVCRLRLGNQTEQRSGTYPGERIPLSLKSAGSETPQVVARIPGQIGMRVCTCEICHRPTYACLHWG